MQPPGSLMFEYRHAFKSYAFYYRVDHPSQNRAEFLESDHTTSTCGWKYVTYAAGAVVVQPTGTLEKSQVQDLFDNLWLTGFRPTENKDDKPALQAHLDDAIRVRDQLLGVVLPSTQPSTVMLSVPAVKRAMPSNPPRKANAQDAPPQVPHGAAEIRNPADNRLLGYIDLTTGRRVYFNEADRGVLDG